MLKKNKGKLLLSSILVLLPILIGLLLWNQLPDSMITHWGTDGVPDGTMGKAAAIFILPLILLVLHWVCVFFTCRDAGNQNQSPKVVGLVLWIMPIISIFSSGIIYLSSLGRAFDMIYFMPVTLGLMFVILGNYMPKCKQNYTIGVKVKWTLESQENWNATHRFAGKAWVIGGFLTMLTIFLPEKAIMWVVLPLIFVFAFLPMIYSYVFYRMQLKQGILPEKKLEPVSKSAKIITAVMLPLILIFVIVILFSGGIEYELNDSWMKINGSFGQKMTVDYAAVDGMEYRESMDFGVRTFGFGSPKLSMGTFQNDEFGAYRLYAYVGCKACIVLENNGSMLVINAKNAEETMALYEKLLEKIPQN